MVAAEEPVICDMGPDMMGDQLHARGKYSCYAEN